jgi:metal-responsive CopG/Arc/MetJ family transcriptional regulator
MAITITIPEDLVKGINKIIDEGGFQSPEEFIAAAIEQKLLELQKEKFYQLTDEIRQGIEKKGYTVKRVIEEIEKLRHEDHHSG